LYQPLFNALVLLYQLLPGNDFGIAIIVLTLFIRIVLLPLTMKSLRSQKALSKIQEKTQEIQEKYKKDKEKQMQEIVNLYQREKINPFGSLLPVLIQLPILIALYRVFWKGLQPEELSLLYAGLESFIPKTESISPYFLNLLDLSKPDIWLAVLAGIFQFFQSKMLAPKLRKKTQNREGIQISEIASNQMLLFFPLFTTLILFKLPAAVALYWIVTILFSILQQHLFLRPQTESLG
jgi:YidC/Oxa1 family membrane protein insertase